MDSSTSTSKNPQSRLKSYKHHGKDSNELRRQRHQNNVSLRKVIPFESLFSFHPRICSGQTR